LRRFLPYRCCRLHPRSRSFQLPQRGEPQRPTRCHRGTIRDLKKAIFNFVERVTKQGSPDFVPEAERIATFDNDGTLRAEQPMYFQLLFALDRVKALAPKHPEWKTEEPFASLLKGDIDGAIAGGEPAIFKIVAATHSGMTVEEFNGIARDRFATAKHPVTKRLHTEMVYQPMLELLAYLRASAFKTFIVSGGGIDLSAFFPNRSMAFRPSRSSAAAARRNSRCKTANGCSCVCRRLILSTTVRANRLV
jgi:phosphoglycolate phosphatase-like HAD superfamily hydrolase